MTKKCNLPHKICTNCGLSFAWRKKWSRCWDEVTHCSKRCKSEAKKARLQNHESQNIKASTVHR
ncbi:MAG: DUF2256 domain-containing protein [Porticoccaceae bacterium]|nr:DUF2256 domain-containing protein [Porticoccaceae bacterium]